jgi:predicted lactoylglutathione lyase
VNVPARLSFVTLGVTDVARSTAFYESLGWTRSSASVASTTFFNLEGPVLSLFGREALAGDAGVSADGSGFRAVTVAINVASAAEVDDVYAEWRRAGATAVRSPGAAEWGGYTAYVADPDGHLWEIAHNPFFELRADGVVRAPA